ncbi:putative zinc-binding oxidoreductase ToxD [Talaromyces proteolyticus]|uniref:Zinc-binding oxidoreductase ToxD n=1 Tax=Talaromyces proteolyticus TaxID=1131652 RepID=A0AAD4Q6Z2_9EURO|nr:putative zinc-binding oxidoreductase ToxD [Talaromyces proteolyticus]KAH8705822.1 putative zinc-binding oxidoreductase ToxD [Talaromyces proteolyticus]
MKNYGLIREGAGKAVLRAIPVPKLREDYILVKTAFIALNPTDWTTLDAAGDDGTIVGCDYAGVVETVGKSVRTPFKQGDRVAGFAHGGNDANPENGAFARYIAVKGDTQLHIPDGVSFEAACSVGVGVTTTGYALYHVLKLPLPGSMQQPSDKTILVYGGSTATGTIAIQFAKMSGMRVVTTCSPKHFELMRQLGADLVFDYHVPKVGEKIRAATDDKLKIVFDTVNVESSAAICADAIGPDGGRYCNLLGLDCPRSDVQSTFFLGYSVSGESYIFEGEKYDARPQDFDFASKFMRIAEKLWDEGRWKPHPQRVGSCGLLGALAGMDEMRKGRYSGEKLVYRVEETTWP